jgi:internalin A
MGKSTLLSDGSFLCGLTGLNSLDLSYNSLSDGSFLRALIGLNSLSLSGNPLRDGSFLRDLTGLNSLELSGNPVHDWSFLRELTGLTSLDLSDNSLSDGSFLRELTGLTSLDVSSNKLTQIHWASDLLRLRSLRINQNRITSLPPELLRLGVEIESKESHKLLPQSINVGGNPLESPPLEVVRQGHSTIVTWFAETQEPPEPVDEDEQERPLGEVKVILVGDGGAGKTSLRKRLMGEDVDPQESQTHGIEIHDCRFQVGGRELLVHFWDFGGQEIMHATHQFFLSRRSLYLLVLDGRKEEDAEYWLEHIKAFGGDSPVLVVLNKMDENPGFEVDRRDLLRKYGNHIADFFRISCVKKRSSGIPELKKALQKTLSKVELAHTNWPPRWFRVKTRLQESARDFIEYSEYEQICREEKLDNEDSQAVLVRFLHDLGVVLHFEESYLETTQVLEPRWVTQAVYRIINAPVLADRHGVLPVKRLKDILKKTEDYHYKYPQDKHHYIIELMKKFELCYELPDPGERRILVPDLLERQEPAFDFPTQNVLRFRYQYEFLPRSVMPRFIVRQQTDIDGELRWRTGVVLVHPETKARAVVRSDQHRKRISIEVSGKDQAARRDYFKILRETFRQIHGDFQSLAIEQEIPLPDSPDHTVAYSDLLFHEEKGRDEILVGSVRREYQVRDLLDGIESVEDRQQHRAEERREGHSIHNHFHGDVDMSKKTRVNGTGNVVGDGNSDLNVTAGKDINQVTAGHIQNAFNKAHESGKSDELKRLLENLTRETALVAEALPENKAEEAASDLERLADEVTKEKPDRRYWELSLDGVKNAATAVGHVGKTALSLAANLITVLS